MNYLKQNHLTIILGAVILVASLFSVFKPNLFGAFNSTTFTNPIIFSSTVTHSGAVTNSAAVTNSLTVTNNGAVTFNANRIDSYTNATTTPASLTLAAADILYSSVLMTPTVGAITVTLPATSTLSSFVPVAGDRADLCLYNATTTAAATITLAAGTGMDLETASSSPTDLTLVGGNNACFRFLRYTNTDIGVLMTEFSNGD